MRRLKGFLKLGEHPAHLSGRLPSWTVFQSLVLRTSLCSPPLRSGGRLARSSCGGLRVQRPRAQWQTQDANVPTKRRLRRGGAPPSGADLMVSVGNKASSFAPRVCGPSEKQTIAFEASVCCCPQPACRRGFWHIQHDVVQRLFLATRRVGCRSWQQMAKRCRDTRCRSEFIRTSSSFQRSRIVGNAEHV